MNENLERTFAWKARPTNLFHQSYVLKCCYSDRFAVIYAGSNYEWLIWGSPKPEGVPHGERGSEHTLSAAQSIARQALMSMATKN